MTELAEFFSETLPVEDPLRADIVAFIRARHAATPRHQQVALGPSEVGHPCMRRMAFGMMNEPRCNPEYDPLPSIIGTATHTWMESAAQLDNERLGRDRWLIEHRVEVAPGLSGSCDLFDTDTGTVVDYKFPGYTSFTKYLNDPGLVYQNQAHLYGKGFENSGRIVDRVAIAFFPRTGTLSKMHFWSEDYDRARAEAVLAKRYAVMALLDDFKVEIDSSRYDWIPMEPYECVFCNWWSDHPRSPIQCSGRLS